MSQVLKNHFIIDNISILQIHFHALTGNSSAPDKEEG